MRHIKATLARSSSKLDRVLHPVNWGDLRRLAPFSDQFGFDRGLPIDRYYIQAFLRAHADLIKGAVLEVGDDVYTRKYGAAKVTVGRVLHATTGNPQADVVADLSDPSAAEKIGLRSLDCIILTQVLQMVSSPQAVLQNLYAVLRVGGCLLATFPGISQISRYDMDRWGDFWRFTDASARRLFGDVFGPSNVEINIFGNVLSATALLYGMAESELTRDELDHLDANYQVTLAVAATR